jgi:hypothetical protein
VSGRRQQLVVWEGELVVPGRELILAHDPDNPRPNCAVARCWWMPTCAAPANTCCSALAMGLRFERVVHEWRCSYEFVVIDTPPTSLFSDALAAATAVGTA